MWYLKKNILGDNDHVPPSGKRGRVESVHQCMAPPGRRGRDDADARAPHAPDQPTSHQPQRLSVAASPINSCSVWPPRVVLSVDPEPRLRVAKPKSQESFGVDRSSSSLVPSFGKIQKPSETPRFRPRHAQEMEQSFSLRHARKLQAGSRGTGGARNKARHYVRSAALGR